MTCSSFAGSCPDGGFVRLESVFNLKRTVEKEEMAPMVSIKDVVCAILEDRWPYEVLAGSLQCPATRLPNGPRQPYDRINARGMK
jgi:hypothetical protein